MPRFLKDLTVHEVSSVDRGAGEGVRILLMKRAGSDPKLDDQIRKANAAFETAVAQVMADKTIIDKVAAIDEIRTELNDHLATLKAETETDMPKTEAEIQKAIDDGVAAATKKLEGELAFAKMSDVHKGYATEVKLEGDNLAKFVGMTAEQRDAFVKEFPPKKKPGKGDEADCEKSAIEKALEPFVTENIALKKRLDAADEKEQITAFAKRATDLGLAEADGEIMRKAYGGDKESQTKLDEKIKALSTQVAKGGLFTEVGKTGGQGGAKAYDEIMAKAQELMKADPKLSQAQAFTKAYTDPANVELAKRHRSEENAGRGIAA